MGTGSVVKGLIVPALLSILLTGCWDKIELNQLALVSMIGADIEPESGIKTIYYQVINPLSGASAMGTTGGDQAPVYTYKISGRSFGEIRSNVYQRLPRRLFVAHYKAVVVSERAAEHGIRDIVNYIEVQQNARSSIPMLVADGSISKIMKTYTPLESLPSDSVESRLRFLAEDSLFIGKHIRVKDVSERMQQSRPVVLPLIREAAGSSFHDSGKRAAEIDANKGIFLIGGGAVIQNYRLAGRLNENDMIWYHLLTGETGEQKIMLKVGGKQVTVVMKPVRFDQAAAYRRNKPVVSIRLDLELSTSLATESIPRTWEDVEQLEREVKEQITDGLYAFYNKTKEKGWDLLGLKETVRRHLPQLDPGSAGLNDVDVVINVGAKLLQPGSINQPF
ncbi:MAG: spore gernimation protein GerC [Bacillus thermozeamaize]|uniref:Spore gernimation protein GerC n=1 Tax=Bacillus thermozeamaize TaxID=230954 RepID=A0A1Y3PR05_9BACI|nr:MAG: spore gernimation protein GerC [Bacillus thermozeamaize]